MNKQEYLLSKLAEECCEVAQRCHKAQTFGLEEIQPGQELNNAQRIFQEYSDLVETYDICIKEGVLPLFDYDQHNKYRGAKNIKLIKFADYSREKGCLSE